ncbi:MAG: methyltransferase domain-containing protein, partial [Bacteroidota bacterium]
MTSNPGNDIFGIAFLDYLKGEHNADILVNTDIAEDEKLPVRYFFRGFDEMPEWEQLVLRKCLGRTLDVGAGAGSHALYLQQQGIEITALDISPGSVD